MKDKSYSTIESILDRLIKGDIYIPIKVEGIGEYYKTLLKLEELRQSLVKINDDGDANAKKNHTMIASVAHDLKTPLQLIHGYAECLQDGIDDKDYAKLIGEKSEKLNELVLSLVDLSQGEINKVKANYSIQYTDEFFTPVCEQLPSLLEVKHDKLVVSKIPKVRIRIESYEIGRVIQNLISNAVKYSKDGSTIKVKFLKSQYFFYIKVQDEGMGIAKENLPHIFDKFYKEDKSRTDVTSNGLGLYISKQIVENHGGKISVKSKKGKGTTFIVRLPIVQDGVDRSFVGKFDFLDKVYKLLISLFFGYFLGFVYRFAKFIKTRRVSTLVGAFLAILLMPFMYIFDFISIAAYDKLIFLAD